MKFCLGQAKGKENQRRDETPRCQSTDKTHTHTTRLGVQRSRVGQAMMDCLYVPNL